METAQRELPRYRSHKIVWALKIKEITPSVPGRVMLEFEHPDYAPKESSIINRPVPSAGWYFVVYEDGYHSFSPAETFEKGNTLITPSSFEAELARLLNRHSIDNSTDTPDFILANYMKDCLVAYRRARMWTSAWHSEVGVPTEWRVGGPPISTVK